MLFKTIKTMLIIGVVTAFLSACSTTSKPTTDNIGPNISDEVTASNSIVSSNGSNKVSVSDSVVAPLGTIFYFDFDSSVLSADSRQLLNQHVSALKAKPRAVRLEGHADERGTREYNIALGERRAKVIRTYFVTQGVYSPIEVVSYGEESPAVDESNEYAWQQNRRVEIK